MVFNHRRDSQLLELYVSQSAKDVESDVIEFSFSWKGISVWTGICVRLMGFTVNFKDTDSSSIVGSLVFKALGACFFKILPCFGPIYIWPLILLISSWDFFLPWSHWVTRH